jgi:hypothetical protein
MRSERRVVPLGFGAPLFASLAVLLMWRGMLSLSLFGWDTFPLIAAARIESFDDLARALTSELMGGRFPGGHYWRPMVHLSFALDHALWELDAFGYHLTDFVLLALSTSCVIWIARHFLKETQAHWAYLAGLVFVLHPVHFEVAALPPRRADALALVFTLLAVLAALRRPGRTSAWASICALLACASKETGVLVPALLLAVGFCGVRNANWRMGIVGGVRASWVAIALAGLFLAGRAGVVRGLGGGARASVEGAGAGMGRAAERYGELVLAPLPPSWIPAGPVLLVIAAACALYLFVASWKVDDRRAGDGEFAPRQAALLVAMWCGLVLIVTALAGTYRAWYALPFVAPLALITATAAAAARKAGTARTAVAIGVLALAQGWLTSNSARWSELELNSRAASEFLAHFDEVVTSLPPGSVAELSAYPDTAAATRHGEDIHKAMLFREYSLAAYAELAHAGRALRIEVKRGTAEHRAGPDELLVLLLPRADAVGSDDGGE